MNFPLCIQGYSCNTQQIYQNNKKVQIYKYAPYYTFCVSCSNGTRIFWALFDVLWVPNRSVRRGALPLMTLRPCGDHMHTQTHTRARTHAWLNPIFYTQNFCPCTKNTKTKPARKIVQILVILSNVSRPRSLSSCYNYSIPMWSRYHPSTIATTTGHLSFYISGIFLRHKQFGLTDLKLWVIPRD